MLFNYIKPVKISRGVLGTNEWDRQPALLRSGHTSSVTAFPAWMLTRNRAARAYSALVHRIHAVNKEMLTCPTCYSSPRGISEILFVDVGDNLRGPMCFRCLKEFLDKNPNISGYPVLIFRAEDIGKLPDGKEVPSIAAQIKDMRKVEVPLKDLI